MARPKITASELIARSSISKGRRLVTYKGSARYTSHLIWNMHYPNDPVLPGEIVHHDNRDKLDDRIENYKKMTKTEHALLHQPERTAGLQKKLTGIPRTEEVKKKISDAHTGKVLSQEHCAKLSESHKGNRHSVEAKAKMVGTQKARREAELKWSPTEALRLRKMGVSKREIGRRLGNDYSNIQEYFTRRGLFY